MATQDSKLCAICNKSRGIIPCTGCNHSFCIKCHPKHLADIRSTFQERIIEHDTLKNEFSQMKQENVDNHPIIIKIKKWRDEITKRVKETADNACRQVYDIINEDRNKIIARFEKVYDDMKVMKADQEYLEPEVKQIKDEIDKIGKMIANLKKPKDILLNTNGSDQINWNQLLIITKKSDEFDPSSSLG